jgi:signal transduction histidine kinase
MLAEDADVEAREDLQRIRSAGGHLLRIITAVLDVAKIEAGHINLEVEPVSVDAFVSELVGTIDPLASAGDNSVTAAVDETAGIIHTDGTKLRQVVFNLLANACKFTEGGEVVLEARGEPLGGVDGVTLEVRDTGVGIPTGELDRLFEDFTQVNGAETKRLGGAGLGLAISRRLTNLLGGHIGVESTPGEGTTFAVWLPRSAPFSEGTSDTRVATTA